MTQETLTMGSTFCSEVKSENAETLTPHKSPEVLPLPDGLIDEILDQLTPYARMVLPCLFLIQEHLLMESAKKTNSPDNLTFLQDLLSVRSLRDYILPQIHSWHFDSPSSFLKWLIDTNFAEEMTIKSLTITSQFLTEDSAVGQQHVQKLLLKVAPTLEKLTFVSLRNYSKFSTIDYLPLAQNQVVSFNCLKELTLSNSGYEIDLMTLTQRNLYFPVLHSFTCGQERICGDNDIKNFIQWMDQAMPQLKSIDMTTLSCFAERQRTRRLYYEEQTNLMFCKFLFQSPLIKRLTHLVPPYTMHHEDRVDYNFLDESCPLMGDHGIKAESTLESLDLENVNVDTIIDSMSKCQAFEKLTSLTLYKCQISSSSLIKLFNSTFITQLKSLKIATIANNNNNNANDSICNDTFDKISSSIPKGSLDNLQELKFIDRHGEHTVSFDIRSISMLMERGIMNNVQKLELNVNCQDNQEFKKFINLPQVQNLTKLSLPWSKLSQSSCGELVHSIYVRDLKDLSIEGVFYETINDLTGDGSQPQEWIVALFSLPNNLTNLTHLNISYCDCQTCDLMEIINSPLVPNLIELKIKDAYLAERRD